MEAPKGECDTPIQNMRLTGIDPKLHIHLMVRYHRSPFGHTGILLQSLYANLHRGCMGNCLITADCSRYLSSREHEFDLTGC